MANSNSFFQSSLTYSPASPQQLEKLWHLPAADKQTTQPKQPSRLLKRLGQVLLAFFTGEQTVRIWTSYSDRGVVWHVYDPQRNYHDSYSSEQDLRTWLESRHIH